MKKKSPLIYPLALLLLLQGCAPLIIGGGAATGALAVGAITERRTVKNLWQDNVIANKIRMAILSDQQVSAGNINVSVYEGKVLLTGAAASPQEIAKAVQIARTTPGVKEVASELKVQHETATELAFDALISNKIKFNMLADRYVSGLDIHVETTKQVVFLTGIARTVGERDRAIEISSSVEGVREVVSYVEIRPPTPVAAPVSTQQMAPVHFNPGQPGYNPRQLGSVRKNRPPINRDRGVQIDSGAQLPPASEEDSDSPFPTPQKDMLDNPPLLTPP
ncbi:BON domain-containing protein [Magnetococcales bacterium HHB-1]